MNNNQESENTLQTAATAAIAATTKTPFRTAFKITMGIALANVLSFLIVVAGLGIIVGGLLLVLK